MENREKIIGTATNRTDEILKVTGAAKYATDYKIKNAARAVIFKSEIAVGKILNPKTARPQFANYAG